MLAHLAPGGTFVLMNRAGRPGLDAVLAALRGAPGGRIEEQRATLLSNWDSTEMMLAVFVAGGG